MIFYITAIAKQENLYIREWVEYHLNIGVEKIILFDNNDIDGERFDDVIGDYISEQKVKVIDIRGIEQWQNQSYNLSYRLFGGGCDWMCFIDCDEFITLSEGLTLGSWVSDLLMRNPSANCIKINWMCYGDCGKLYYEDKPVLERFPYSLPLDTKTIFSFPQNFHVKSIVKGGLGFVEFRDNPHIPLIDGGCYCDSCGYASSYSPYMQYNYNVAYIRHYVTKTIEEWKMKMKRGYPDQPKSLSTKYLTYDMFFLWNEKTTEKLQIAGI